jgi:hypothetical protein
MDAGIAMTDFVVSCSAGYVDKTPICGKSFTLVINTNSQPLAQKI